MDELIAAARRMQDRSYAPYSAYAVGAAIRTADGTVYTGCNIENANFSNSLHAEEVALASALKDGQRDFTAIAVSTAERDSATPCGMCRQTLSEFSDGSLTVLCDAGDSVITYTLGELLPESFSKELVLGR